MSKATHGLLVEIGTEELPPKSLHILGAAFAEGIDRALSAAGLKRGELAFYVGPRRLAVLVHDLEEATASAPVEKMGPAVKAAFDGDGKPTAAAEGFARNCGVSVVELETVDTEKGPRLCYRATEPGQATAGLLPGIVERALAQLPVARRMRWGEGDAEFVRPVHWIVLLFGGDVIDCEILGIRTGNSTRGHRHHHPDPITLSAPDGYVEALRAAKVRVNDRDGTLAQEISRQVRAAAAQAGGVAVNGEPDSALVSEVAALVEWPVALRGEFDPAYLDLPDEVLIATLQSHQRYFPVRDGDSGKLLSCFITLANIESRDPDVVRRGNERVVAPRLADAMFFWNSDRKTSLADRAAALDDIVFQQQLGSLGGKMRRVARLAGDIAMELGGDAGPAARAAQLAKCDLLSDLVGEFPELQGVMGRYFAEHDREPAEVASAIGDQYAPRFAGDALPRTLTGRALAVADKLDTVVGIFAIGQPPTGEKDPFGLRRAALGLLRIMIEGPADLDLPALIRSAYALCMADIAAAAQAGPKKGTKPAAKKPAMDPEAQVNAIFDFMMERLRRYYLDDGIRADVFDAVLSRVPPRPLDFHRRLHAVTAFSRLPESESLAAANKRIRNILRQAGGEPPAQVDEKLLREDAERDLARDVDGAAGVVQPLIEGADYTAALTHLAGLRGTVDRFFDDVMVMCDDTALRDNRLALLNRLSELFLTTADISLLQPAPNP